MVGLKATAKIGMAAMGLLALTGCLKLSDNAMREGPNGVEIQINEGRNCWANKCFRYDADENEIVVSGREPITVPAGVDLSDGYVSEAEFAALLLAARKAPPVMRQAEGSTDGGSSGRNGHGTGSGGAL
ncbi:hypothetical protein TL5118_02263 [Thalassovita autumnalis]|uniref:Lipoprotein n=2 Tax=Thalassovita autumnalis TaxID=2072972 RepID=A0A0P1FXY8_9RHOB|nr:hypothetical protein TL5118_02263 [Thalassovita autumnalis]CUH73961.1 hypothetical protein TL5120_03778 [Thalassovita autumnalis]